MDIKTRMVYLVYELDRVKNRKGIQELEKLCVENPSVIASLVFDPNLESDIKIALLFSYSMDGEGCALKNKPLWVRMMRKHIIPNMNQIGDSFIEGNIKWWQEMYGL